jgi:hypothetical protein
MLSAVIHLWMSFMVILLGAEISNRQMNFVILIFLYG